MLAPGTRLGPYEVLAPLGAGGMGEVYRARDTRLGRDVAVKVLPQHLSSSPEVRARFEREAKTVSSLNHPHICTLFDVGREAGQSFLVMELVEGETLAARLERGPLPTAEVLRTAIEIADALDRAHRAGVVHRDLKPGNVMLTKSGAKLMDFGLARATGLAGASGSGVSAAALTQSPTVAAPLTAEGTIVGTFQYMAPEQLEGKEADARADIWALGCVLYEMATGRRAFEGRSQASLIGAIMNSEPAPIASVQPLSPPAIERVARACLAKDADDRVQTAHDVRLQLSWIAEGLSPSGAFAPAAAAPERRPKLDPVWLLGAGLVVAAIGFGAGYFLHRAEPQRVVRFIVAPPSGARSMDWPRVSPDGLQLAFLSTDSARTSRIWIRPLRTLTAYPLPGTEGAGRPFWSPDSRFLGFIGGGKLKKVEVSGGLPQLVCDAPGGADGSWGTSGIILFDGGPGDSILGVPASGGVPAAATTLDRSAGETGNAWPFFLPDGKHFLFLAGKLNSSTVSAVKLGTLGSLNTHVIGQSESRIEFTPPNRLVFVRGGTLLVQTLDMGRGKLVDEPVPVGESVSLANSGAFSVSAAGVVAYASATAAARNELVWMDRAGRRVGVAAPPGAYTDLALSPDGGRVAVGMAGPDGGSEDIWIRDLARGTTSKLTFDPGEDLWPVWSPGGDSVLYATNRSGEFRLTKKSASGVGAETEIPGTPGKNDGPDDWSGANHTILVQRLGAGRSWSICTLDATSARRQAEPFLQSQFSQSNASFSPDGRFVAYASNESGRNEVYVVPFHAGGGKWQISTSGGTQPYWRRDGKELFFLSGDLHIMAADVTTGSGFIAGVPRPLFPITPGTGGYARNRWVPAADGQKFFVNSTAGVEGAVPFTVVTGWTEELKRK